jgi:hypothetical protein
MAKKEDGSPIRLAYERSNRDLDPQLVWRGKEEQDWSDLVVAAPPLFIQEKVHPKVLIDDGRDEPLNLIVEVKGQRGQDAKEKASALRAFWCPASTTSKSSATVPRSSTPPSSTWRRRSANQSNSSSQGSPPDVRLDEGRSEGPSSPRGRWAASVTGFPA